MIITENLFRNEWRNIKILKPLCANLRVFVLQELEVEDVEDSFAEDDGQPLVVRDVLVHGSHYLAAFLI